MKKIYLLLSVSFLSFLCGCTDTDREQANSRHYKRPVEDSLRQAFQTVPYINVDSAAKAMAGIRVKYVREGDKKGLMEYYK